MTPTMKGDLMFPSLYLAAPDLQGRDATVTIAKIEKAELRTTKGSEEKWVVSFREAKKLLVLNRTNARQIADLHGAKAEAWIGKRVTLYPATCSAFGKIVDCVRVRDRVAGSAAKPRDPDRKPGHYDVDELPPPDPNEGT